MHTSGSNMHLKQRAYLPYNATTEADSSPGSDNAHHGQGRRRAGNSRMMTVKGKTEYVGHKMSQ